MPEITVQCATATLETEVVDPAQQRHGLVFPGHGRPRPRLLPATARSATTEIHGPLRRTVVLARDELVRRGLLDVLSNEPALRLLIEYGDPKMLHTTAAQSLADLAVVDLATTEECTTGIAEVTAVKSEHPDLAIVLLARDLTDDDLLAAVYAGVNGLVSRSSPVEDLVAVLEVIGRGESALDPHFTSALMRALRSQSEVDHAALTSREREVLRLVSRGHRNGAVARELFISESTVKFHLRNITDKLGAASRAEVVSIAVRLGLD